MNHLKGLLGVLLVAAMVSLGSAGPVFSRSEAFKENIFPVGQLKPTDSKLKVKVGGKAPDFTLPSVGGEKISLRQFQGKKNVVLSFVPAAWTPVCSDQWPGYNITQGLFEEHNAILLGITVDNIPTLYSWTNQMGRLWFPVLSDFFPHGAVAARFGILRTDGTSERALFVIDKKGIIRYIDVHDINQRPPLEALMGELGKLERRLSKINGFSRARIKALLDAEDYAGLMELSDAHGGKVSNSLISLAADLDEERRWRAIRALGLVTARMYDREPEQARRVVRQLIWNLNEESGGIGWGMPEAFGEILALREELAVEYGSILACYLIEPERSLDHEDLQRGVIWALGRLKVFPKEYAGGSRPGLDQGAAAGQSDSPSNSRLGPGRDRGPRGLSAFEGLAESRRNA